MRGTLALVGGAGLGAGLMYLLDPERGERRRSALSESVAYAVNDAADRFPALAVSLPTRWRARGRPPPGWRRRASCRTSPRASMRRGGRPTLRRRRAVPRRCVRSGATAGSPCAAGIPSASSRTIAGHSSVWPRASSRRRVGSLAARAGPGAPGNHHRRADRARVRRVVALRGLPRFMPMVAEVRPVGEDRWHWVIAGPAERRSSSTPSSRGASGPG